MGAGLSLVLNLMCDLAVAQHAYWISPFKGLRHRDSYVTNPPILWMAFGEREAQRHSAQPKWHHFWTCSIAEIKVPKSLSENLLKCLCLGRVFVDHFAWIKSFQLSTS